MQPPIPTRPRSTLLTVLLLWIAFYASFTLFTPPLLDDADSVHVEVAREMLLRHDYITLYANGIRYLEKAPLLYWSIAASMKLATLFGATEPRTLAAAARIPLAMTMLALALLAEAFARCLFRTTVAGLYAALILLSSFGLFLFTRITIPDAMVCLFTTLALYAFWRTEELGSPPSRVPHSSQSHRDEWAIGHLRAYCGLFAAACAFNVLTKGLIGVVFPIAIVLLYLLLTRGLRPTLHRLRELHPLAMFAVFLLIAAPWHILAGLANPTQGHPTPFHFVHGHWQVPLPTDGNVRGWFWFYFMNEHLLRYLNLRVPHDYDTSPLWLFWGLCFVWIMPWSAVLFNAMYRAIPWRSEHWLSQLRRHHLPLLESGRLLLALWAAVVLIFFTFSTRQEYYVLPALPAIAMLTAGWLDLERRSGRISSKSRAAIRCTVTLLVLGTLFALVAAYLLLHTHKPAPNTDLATLLTQNPSDYALSMGHFLDLTTSALSLFRVPYALSALALFCGPLVALILRKRAKPHAANLALAAGAFTFLLAAHLALQTFAPVLSSAQLAQAIAPQVRPQDLLCIHGEYESGSSLALYLKRDDIHILDGRSSNLWYGSFFPDAPKIFETRQTLGEKWSGSQRIFLWQDTQNEDQDVFNPTTPVYILVKSGGKEILSNEPNR